MPRLFWRFFFSLWFTVVIFAGLMGAVSDTLARRAGVGQVLEMVEDRLAGQARRIRQVLEQRGPREVVRALRQQPGRNRNWLFIIDDHGKELLGRDRLLKRIQRQRDMPGGRRMEVTAADGRKYVMLLAPQIPRGVLVSQTPLGTLLRLTLAALISALVSYFLARSLAAPLEHLRQTSRNLADGDLAARSGVAIAKRRDEIGLLARDFDRMAGQLQTLDRSRRRLLRDVSHELRSPLARLQVALELARGKQSGQLAAELDRIELESGRLNELIDQVLSLLRETSSSQPLVKQALDLGGLLQSLVEQVNYEALDEAGIVYHGVTVTGFKGDPELLRRALENILRNALLHTDPQQGVAVELQQQGDSALIRIRDFGSGVPDEALGHLFEPFYRVSDARERSSGGYGLGLAIAAAAVERHAGSIKARNHPTGGLQVEISLPLA